MRLVSVKCPECGARVSLPQGADRVRCEYCGTTSLARRRTRFLEVPVAPRQPAGQPKMPVATQLHTRRFFLFGMVLPFLFAGIGGVFVFLKEQRRQTAIEDKYGWVSPHPILHDVNGDGTLDVVGAIHYVSREPSVLRIAAFDGTSGDRLWQSESIADERGQHGTLTLAGETIIVATDLAKLTGYSVKDGKRMWTSSLPEAPWRPCAGPVFITADDKRHAVDPKTGAVTLAPDADRKHCPPIATDIRDSAGPDVAYSGTDSWDIRRPSRLDGMYVAYLLFPRGSDVSFAFGSRDEGTAVPMIAAFRTVPESEDKASYPIVWQQVVPATQPLAASTGAPERATVDDRFVVVAYEMKDGPHRLACFRRADGTRVWDVALPEKYDWLFGLETTDDLVYVSDNLRMGVYSLADGSFVREVAALNY